MQRLRRGRYGRHRLSWSWAWASARGHKQSPPQLLGTSLGPGRPVRWAFRFWRNRRHGCCRATRFLLFNPGNVWHCLNDHLSTDLDVAFAEVILDDLANRSRANRKIECVKNTEDSVL